MLKLENWLHGLFGGFIGGGSSAASAWLALLVSHNSGLDVPTLNLKAFCIVFLTSGLISALAYLQKSPLPDLVEETTTTATATTVSTVSTKQKDPTP